MTDTALGAAVTRLERAIARLEGAPAGVPDDDALRRLDARHQQLRARVGETVARLDALIVAGEATS